MKEVQMICKLKINLCNTLFLAKSFGNKKMWAAFINYSDPEIWEQKPKQPETKAR